MFLIIYADSKVVYDQLHKLSLNSICELPGLCLRGGESYQDDANKRHNQGAIQNSAQYGKDPFLIFLEKTGNSQTCANQEDKDCEEKKQPYDYGSE